MEGCIIGQYIHCPSPLASPCGKIIFLAPCTANLITWLALANEVWVGIWHFGAEAITWLCHIYFPSAIEISQSHTGTGPLLLVPEWRTHEAELQETSGEPWLFEATCSVAVTGYCSISTSSWLIHSPGQISAASALSASHEQSSCISDLTVV